MLPTPDPLPPTDAGRCPVCQATLLGNGTCVDCLTREVLFAEVDDDGSDPAEADAVVLAGQTHRFRLGAFHASGRTGALHHGTDLATHQPVALKILRPDMANTPEGVQRFLAETELVQRLQSLQHPNIVKLIDAGCDPATGQHFVAMQFEPDTLSTWIRVHTVSVPRALGWLVEMCAALTASHQLGIIHGDLKPANSLLDKEFHVRLTDWGLAGTPGYLAPEIIDGDQDAVVTTDIYAVGMIMYQLLTGRHRLPESPLASSYPGVPKACDAIIRRALAFKPEERYQSAAELSAALQHVLKQQLHPPLHHRRWFQVVAACAALGIVTAGSISVGRFRQQPTPVPPIPLASPSASDVLDAAPEAPTPVFATAPVSSAFTKDRQPQPNPAVATIQTPFQNSLGQWFVPIPGDTSRLLSCTETRLRDYSAFAAAWPSLLESGKVPQNLRVPTPVELRRPSPRSESTASGWWETEPDLTPDHPVSAITWYNARAFCWWLTEREHAAGTIPASAHYRLPTNNEWTMATIPPDGTNFKYPWGDTFPAPEATGNFAGPETRQAHVLPRDWTLYPLIDSFATAAPVASFAANPNGYFDLTGNLQEWTADTSREVQNTYAHVRGTSWASANPAHFDIRFQHQDFPNTRYTARGFRPLLELAHPLDRPYPELTLYRFSDLTGTANTAEPGAARKDFPVGQAVRITFRVKNYSPAASPAIVYANLASTGAAAATIYRSPTKHKPALGGGQAVSGTLPACSPDGTPSATYFSFDVPTTDWPAAAYKMSANLRTSPDGPEIESTAAGPALPLHHTFWWVSELLILRKAE